MRTVAVCCIVWLSICIAAYASSFTYSYVPKKLFQNQIFPITILETNQTEGTVPHFRFDTAPLHAKVLFSKPLIIHNGNDRFYTFYFKVLQGDQVYLPPLAIQWGDENTILDEQRIPVKTLQAPDDFCGVLATDFKVRYAQVSHYDESHYLMMMQIEAYEANLEDMHLLGYGENGVEHIDRNFAKVRGEFFLVLPEQSKRIRFTYYNTVKERFIPVEVPVELDTSTVVTQTDLNPKNDNFERFKRYTLYGALVGFVVLFLFSFDMFFLALAVVTGLILFYFKTPHKQICIDEGARMYILPTSNSDIAMRIDHKINVKELNQRGSYHKILYENKFIGWVKDDDLCKD